MDTLDFPTTTRPFGRCGRLPGRNQLLLWMVLAPICLLLSFAHPGQARAGDLSPEFTLLINDITKAFPGLYVGASGVGKSRVCPLLTQFHSANALSQVTIRRAVMGGVVSPLSEGLKFGASASGVGIAGIFIYDLAYCAYTSDSEDAFGRCMVNAAFGVGENYVGGLVAKQTGSNLTGATVSTGLGITRQQLAQTLGNRFWGEWNERIGDYQAVTETYTSEYDDGRCVNSIKATWDRRRNQRPGYLGGMIRLEVTPECDCDKKRGIGPKLGNRGRLERGRMVAEVPVRYVDIGGRKAGWRIGPIKKVRLTGKCCGLNTTYRMAINDQGQRVPWDDPPPPKPKPPTPPPTGGQGSGPKPPAPGWSIANPCPKCVPIAMALTAARQDLADATAKEVKVKSDLADAEAEVDALRKKVASLTSRLEGEDGIGATLFDAAGNKLKSSYDQGNGTVKITTYNPDGSIQSVDYRQRKSTRQIQEELAQARTDLADAEARQQQLANALNALRQLIQQLQTSVAGLHLDLVDCVARHCNTHVGAGGHGTGVGGIPGGGGKPAGGGDPDGGGNHGGGLDHDQKTEAPRFGAGPLPKISGTGGEIGPARDPVGDAGATAVGDFNVDGILDVAIANRVSGQVTVLLGDGLGYPERLIAGSLSWADRVWISDLNFDGLPDLVVASPEISEVATMINDGNGGFRQQPTILADTVPRAVSVDDATTDRTPDLRLDDLSGDGGEIWQGDGTGGFGPCDCGPGQRDPVSEDTFDTAPPMSGPTLIEQAGDTSLSRF